jgi:predicted RNA binding protein YcfA (HicA-like mRNA interferase family)
MSRRLPALSFREVVRALERLGFQIDHVTGSHYRLKHTRDPRRNAVVPRHSRDIKRGVLRSIIRQAGLTVEEFLDGL